MVLICINLYHKKEIECVYYTNWYNTNWLTRNCIVLIHIHLSFSPTNWYTNWLIWICMILIHKILCFYPTNWYVLIHIDLCHKKEIESWIYFLVNILYKFVCTNLYVHLIIQFIWYQFVHSFIFGNTRKDGMNHTHSSMYHLTAKKHKSEKNWYPL